MEKQYISDSHLEEFLVELLRKKAQSEQFSPEDFSFKAILNETQKNHEVDEKKLRKVLNNMENNQILIKPRTFNVYIPVGHEKRFSGLVDTFNPAFFIVLAGPVGIVILSIIFPYLHIQANINLNNPDGFNYFILMGFFIPFFLGSITLIIFKEIFDRIYKNIKIFREMIEFFGGVKIWGYSLFLAAIFEILYISLSMIMRFNIDPYYATGIFTSIFIAVLLGSKQLSKK